MNSSIILGQYIPGNSLIHRLDPRTKIILISIYVIVVFFANNLFSYSVLVIFLITALTMTKIPLRLILKGMMPIWFLIVFTFMLHFFITKEGELLFNFLFINVYIGGVIKGLMIATRFALLVLMTSLLTLTTTPIDITDAIEQLFQPLRRLKFPVHEFALMISIALRFIPTLMQETDKISKAQASRGVDFRTGPIKERLKSIIPLLVPLFVSAFKRAEELAMAMEARGYRGGEGRTKLRELTFTKKDFITFVVFFVLVCAVFFVRDY